MTEFDRLYFGFEEKVRNSFSFLGTLGFKEVEAQPTLVRYQKDKVEVDVYHGRQSYEIGAGITAYGIRYTLSEVIRAVAPEAVEQFRNRTATTPEAVSTSLDELGSLMNQYGRSALIGAPDFFELLGKQRNSWWEEYALDVLAEQLRPKADKAFREKDYATAAELYARIRERLSPAELKKLSLAEKFRQ